MMTVRQWFEANGLGMIELEEPFASQPWDPNEHDRKAAWALYTEMRTRVATQPLHFRSGDEAAALNSIYQLFDMSRRAMMTGADEGHRCRTFADLSTIILNEVVRPFTTKWHKRNTEGRLADENDRHEFRLELKRLQTTLRPFQSALGAMAEGVTVNTGTESTLEARGLQAESAPYEPTSVQIIDAEFKADQAAAWPTTSRDRRERVLKAIKTKLPARTIFSDIVPVKVRQDIRRAEREEIIARRKTVTEIRRRVEPNRQPPLLPAEYTAVEIPGAEDLPATEDAPGAGTGSAEPMATEQAQPLVNLSGLAISGGGIRSATFSLGVIQRLAEHGLLSEFDYLSTVSGGGYTGSFLSSYLNTPNKLVGIESGNYPFRTGRTIETMAIHHIRNHGKYLIYGGMRKLQMFGLAILGVATNVFVLSSLVVLAVLLTKLVMGHELKEICDGPSPTLLSSPFLAIWAATAITSVFTASLLSIIYSQGRSFTKDHLFMRFTRFYEGTTMLSFLAFLFMTGVNALPFLAFFFDHQIYPAEADAKSITQVDWVVLSATLASFLTPLIGFAQYGRKWIMPIGLTLIGLLGPLVLFGAYFALLERFVIRAEGQTTMLLAIMFAVPLCYGALLLNINFNSPHRFYRNRLSDAFLIKPPAEFPTYDDHVREEILSNDHQKLSELRSFRKELPYHLLNAAINTPASKNTNLRGRNSDFFIFSQCYCGSALSGYHPTKSVENLDGHVDLGTAMSISAAAVAPQMGALPFASAAFVLTLLNVRLNYWLRNPKQNVIMNWVARWLSQPNMFYLYREMFNRVDEMSRYVNVSDGGHLENLGVYELLRRRCKYVVVIEGEEDPQMRCGSLMKLIRKAKIDLGVDVHFEIDDFQLQENGFSRASFRVGVIDYGPPGDVDETECVDDQDDSVRPREMGVLIYLKNTMTGSESVALKDYRLNNPPFPHQTTADQYFDEEQFESFRSLGYHVGGEAMRAELFDGSTPKTLDLSQWAETLVKNVFSD